MFVLWLACRPQLSSPGTASAPEASDPPVEPTMSTGATVPGCDVDEIEPNGFGDPATPLGLDDRGCGTIGEAGDTDHWTVAVDFEGWLSLQVSAASIGSPANLRLVLDGPEGDSDRGSQGVGQSPDPYLLVPAVPGSWTAALDEESGRGGVGYAYEVIASEAKEPGIWTASEVEPNNAVGDAMAVGTGDVIYGELDRLDLDFFAVEAPPGPGVDLTISAAAYGLGSPGIFELVAYGEDLETLGRADGGLDGALDPSLSLHLEGGATATIQILEQSAQSGPLYWYLLSVEGP